MRPHIFARTPWLGALPILAFLSLLPLPAQSGEILESEQCGSCHRLEAPSPEARTVEALAQRKGPDLFYAGNKYRAEWLRGWLVAPKRIRPAGLAPYRHARTVDGKDELDTAGLEPHPVLPAGQVDAVVTALMELDWGGDLLPPAAPVAPPIPRMLAEMNFVKFKGCASCHRVAPDYGGVSGPQLYDATERLRAEFLASYIAAPQAWDPVAPMPGFALPDVEVAKLIHYLKLVSAEQANATEH